MKKALKICAYTFGGIFGLIIVLFLAAYPFRNKIIVTAVETFVPQMTKTRVTLGNVDFQPLRGLISIKNLHIGNPKGFSSPDIFSLGEIRVSLRPRSLLSNKIVINDILIDNVAVTYEILTDGTSNVSVIQKNVAGEAKTSSNTPKASSKKTTPSAAKKEAPKTVVIKKFTLKDAQVAAAVAGVKMKLPLPTITLTDIGENKPSTMAEVFSQIMNVFSKETLNAITNATTKAVKDSASTIKSVINGLF